jgi:hypothetical protein
MLIRTDFSTSMYQNLSVKTSGQTEGLAAEHPMTGLGQKLYERRQKQLQEMQASIARLKQLQKETSPKKLARERAGILKQRLDLLKSMMSKLPSGDHKAMARELKQIARELAALSKELKGSGGGGLAMPQVSFGAEGKVAAESTVADADVVQPEAVAEPSLVDMAMVAESLSFETGDVEGEAGQVAGQADTLALEVVVAEHQTGKLNSDAAGLSVTNSNEDADDRELRDILTKARKVLKEVLAMLKAKHQVKDKESHKIFSEIEKVLKDLDKALAQSELALAGTEVETAMADTDAGEAAAAGSIINTTA